MGTTEREQQAEQQREREQMERQQQELRVPRPLMGTGDTETSTNPAIINKVV
jgi:hypothetical protein